MKRDAPWKKHSARSLRATEGDQLGCTKLVVQRARSKLLSRAVELLAPLRRYRPTSMMGYRMALLDCARQLFGNRARGARAASIARACVPQPPNGTAAAAPGRWRCVQGIWSLAIRKALAKFAPCPATRSLGGGQNGVGGDEAAAAEVLVVGGAAEAAEPLLFGLGDGGEGRQAT